MCGCNYPLKTKNDTELFQKYLEFQVWPVCCTCRKGTAEELPFPDGSVDLITAASAAHWFDQSRFLAEASRVLKPRGCMALLSFSDTNTRLHYQDCGERLNHMYKEVGVDSSFMGVLLNQISSTNLSEWQYHQIAALALGKLPFHSLTS